jgi:hypothetical protein
MINLMVIRGHTADIQFTNDERVLYRGSMLNLVVIHGHTADILITN